MQPPAQPDRLTLSHWKNLRIDTWPLYKHNPTTLKTLPATRVSSWGPHNQIHQITESSVLRSFAGFTKFSNLQLHQAAHLLATPSIFLWCVRKLGRNVASSKDQNCKLLQPGMHARRMKLLALYKLRTQAKQRKDSTGFLNQDESLLLASRNTEQPHRSFRITWSLVHALKQRLQHRCCMRSLLHRDLGHSSGARGVQGEKNVSMLPVGGTDLTHLLPFMCNPTDARHGH